MKKEHPFDARIRRTGKRVIQITLNDLEVKSSMWEKVKAKLVNKSEAI